jgi:hypothetical protein
MRFRPDDQKLVALLLRWQTLREQKHQGGYAIVVVVFIAVVLLGLLAAYALSTKTESSSSRASLDSTSGYYTAEGGLNMRAEELMRQFADSALPRGSSPASLAACLDGVTTNDGTDDFACRNYQFGNSIFGGQRRTASTYVVSTNPVVGGSTEAIITTIPPNEPFAGMNVQEYNYQLYSVAQRQAANLETEAVLQMNVRARYLPLFQFAAFYENDLEMNSSSIMTLNGRVHTNSSYFLVGGWNRESEADKITRINGQVTVACPNPANTTRCPNGGSFNGGGMFNTMKDNDTYNNTDGKAQIANSSTGAWISIKSQGILGGAPYASPYRVDPTLISTNTNGQVRLGANFGIQPLTLPPTGTLDRTGDFFNKADIRIEYRPGLAVPFEVRRVDSNSLVSPRANAEVFALSSQPGGSNRGEGVLYSLRQPVLASTTLSAVTGPYAVCPNAPVAAPTTPSLTSSQKDAAVLALQVAIASTTSPIDFSQLQTSPAASLAPKLPDLLSANPLFASDATLRTAVAGLTPVQIAALNGRCFVPPPLQEVQNWRNDRETRLINMIQMNIGSLAVWNRDGVYVDFNNGNVSNNGGGNGFSANQLLYARAGADTSAPAGTLQNLGYVAQDASDGGFAIYATINRANYPWSNGQSPYAFAVTGGRQLLGLARTANVPEPTGLSIISDQAIYLQGNYNSTRTLPVDYYNPGSEPSGVKQPAAIMADTLNILSNLCINANYRIEKQEGGTTVGGATVSSFNGRDRLNCTINGTKRNLSDTAAAFTAINAAFLAATDQTSSGNYNGGLNNFPRTHEDWDLRVPIFIRGSFVSLNYPVHVSGRFRGSSGIDQNDIFVPPIRLWDYDQDFNIASNLPPLTPVVRWIKQDVFLRRFNN